MAVTFPGVLEIIMATLRQQKMLALPVYYWDGTQWVDFINLTNPQIDAWVRALPGITDPMSTARTPKIPNLTVSTRNDW